MSDELTVQNNPPQLLAMAIQKGVDMAQLEKLMDLQERWEAKQAKKAFLDAISKFQTIVPVLSKGKTAKVQTKTGGSFSYKYADLGSIAEAIKKPLNECGLSYRWEFQEANQIMKVTCFISHRDGHTESTSMEAGKDESGAKNAIQQKGSTQTYLQRYTLIGALGLSTADGDNDGKNGTPIKEENPSLTEQEILDQWEQQVSQTTTQIELTSLFIKNKKAVEGSEKIKAIFKAHEQKLKASAKNGSSAKVVMP